MRKEVKRVVPGKTKPRNDNVIVVTATATECPEPEGSAEEAQVPGSDFWQGRQLCSTVSSRAHSASW